MSDQQLTEELHKPVIIKFNKKGAIIFYRQYLRW